MSTNPYAQPPVDKIRRSRLPGILLLGSSFFLGGFVACVGTLLIVKRPTPSYDLIHSWPPEARELAPKWFTHAKGQTFGKVVVFVPPDSENASAMIFAGNGSISSYLFNGRRFRRQDR